MYWFQRHHIEDASLIFQPHPLTSRSRLQSHWLPVQAIKPTLTRAWKLWSVQQGEQNSTFSAIRHEIWLADCAIQPLPMVAVACDDETHPLGFLCGYPRTHHRCFHVCEIALHTGIPELSEEGIAIATSLLETAIDESQQMGYHGWVACDSVSTRNEFWRKLGFSRYDDFTYRRMGYF